MQNRSTFSKHRAAFSVLSLSLTATCLVTTGCGVNLTQAISAPVVAQGVALKGSIHGGQQPVSGSSIQLYAASTTGYGSASYALLTTPVISDGAGGFNITNTYTCPSGAQVYIVATGGNPGAGTNANLAMMAALGNCGNLSASSFISINEITTVASAYALAPFMTGIGNVGTSATNVAGLANAFSAVNRLSNIGNGSAAGTLPVGATAPVAEINTLADVLAACVNTNGGTASDTSTLCGKLFSYSTPTGGTAPTDTIGAILNIARNPGNNVNPLLSLSSPKSPFQPTLSSASDFTVTIKYKPTLSTPSASAIDPGGNVWVTNKGNNTVSVIDTNGNPLPFSPLTGSGLNAPAGVAMDAAGDAFVVNKGGNTLSVFDPTGTGALTTATGLVAPSAVVIDGQGLIWITNSGANSVVAVAASGTTVQSSKTYAGAGITTPGALAINPY